jgi:hypothetical protein
MACLPINCYNGPNYKHWLETLKRRILDAQVKAALKANVELIHLYGALGAEILQKEKTAAWETS